MHIEPGPSVRVARTRIPPDAAQGRVLPPPVSVAASDTAWEALPYLGLLALAFVPLIGLLVCGAAGFSGLSSPARRSQAIALLVVTGVSALVQLGCFSELVAPNFYYLY